MRLSNQQAKQVVEKAISSDMNDEPLHIEVEIENDEWSQLRYKGNLLGYALQVNLEKESIALIKKYPEMCAEFADFNGYCKVSGDTTDEIIPLAVLALKTESNDAFKAFMDAHKLDLSLQAHEATLIDESYWETRTEGIVGLCAGIPGRIRRLEIWAAKEGIEIPPSEKRAKSALEEHFNWDEEGIDDQDDGISFTLNDITPDIRPETPTESKPKAGPKNEKFELF